MELAGKNVYADVGGWSRGETRLWKARIEIGCDVREV